MSVERAVAPSSEVVLLQRVREGSAEAYAILFARHGPGLTRAATALAGAHAADDIVAETFARTLALLLADRGPRISFRAYLFTAMRSIHASMVRRQARVLTVGAPEELVPIETMSVPDDSDVRFDAATVARAFESLPTRWRQVLWLTAVEGRDGAEVAERLELTRGAARALAFRAREGLRRAFIAEHLRRTDGGVCGRCVAAVPAFVRGALPDGRARVLAHHLGRCPSCADAAQEAVEVDRLLGPGRPARVKPAPGRGVPAAYATPTMPGG